MGGGSNLTQETEDARNHRMISILLSPCFRYIILP